MKEIKIIITDWDGYPLQRKKNVGGDIVDCGIENSIKNMSEMKCDRVLKVHLVINSSANKWKYKLFPSKRGELTSKEQYYLLKEKYPIIEKISFRNNVGMDIGAYDLGLKELMKSNYHGDVVFMNSSVAGPSKNHWLTTFQTIFNSRDCTGLVGVSLNSHNTNLKPPEFKPHVQSFFLYSNTEVLYRVFSDGLPGAKVNDDKKRLIAEGEIGISTAILEAGYSISSSIFPTFNYKAGEDWTAPTGDIRFSKEYGHLANKI